MPQSICVPAAEFETLSDQARPGPNSKQATRMGVAFADCKNIELTVPAFTIVLRTFALRSRSVNRLNRRSQSISHAPSGASRLARLWRVAVRKRKLGVGFLLSGNRNKRRLSLQFWQLR